MTKKLFIFIIFLLICAFLSAQEFICGIDHLHNRKSITKSNGSTLLLDHVPIVLTHDQIEPVHLSFELSTSKNVSSFESRMYDYCTRSFIDVEFQDDGSGQDKASGDGIYTSVIPICYNRASPFPEDFELNRLRTTIRFQDGSEEKFTTRLGSYSIQSLAGYDSDIHKIVQEGVSVYIGEHIANIVLPRSFDPLFQDFDRYHVSSLIESLWPDDSDFITLTASFYDTNSSSNSFSAFFMTGVDIIQTFGSFSKELILHELNHKWINSMNSYGLPGNNGHWGFIERGSSAFGQGCYPGAFTSLSNQGNTITFNVSPSQVSTRSHFNDIELALMGLTSFDVVNFPIKYVASPTGCGNSGFTSGQLSSLSKEAFINALNQNPPNQIDDVLGLKAVVLTDQKMSDLEINFLSQKVKEIADFYHEATKGLGNLNTMLTLENSSITDEDGDGYDINEDCNDTDANINPGSEEIINNDIDENCDGLIEIIDNDQDGYHSDIDCDDNKSGINPGAEEILDNDIDENCDGVILFTPTDSDKDGDGYDEANDCDDSNPFINPGVSEIFNNNIDENCDGCRCKFLNKD